MAARIDWARWFWPVALAGLAAPVGVLAGINPELAIATALAFAFLLVVFADLSLGLAVFAYVSFIELAPFGLNDALARLALVIAFFAVIATRRRGELELYSVHPLVTGAFVIFVGWAGLSAVWSESPSMALLSAERYGLDVILLLIVFAAVRTREDLGRVLIAMMLGAVTAAVYGLVAPTGVDAGRLETTLLDPNLLAAALVAGAALAVAVRSMYRSPVIRAVATICGLMCVVAVWLTASRGALVAFAICLVAAIVLADRWRPQVLLATVAIAVAAFGYFAVVASDDVRERLTEPTRGEAQLNQGRTTIWQVAWRAFEDNPGQGVGAGNFRIASRHYVLQPGTLGRSDQILEDPKVVHNVYLEVLTELGIVGFVLFGFAVGFCLYALIVAARLFERAGQPDMQMAAIAIAIALLGVLAANFFISDQYGKQLWLLLGLGPATLAMARAVPPAKETRQA